jgi:UDPglucose--hexose-1-phosphate uridylyltransferase
MTITFRREKAESTFLDPRSGFQDRRESVEVRFDPLTGRTTHYSHVGALAPQRLPLETYNEAVVKGFCPFCAENRERTLPKFPENVVPSGRMARGESLLFPNLFPYDIYSAVVIMTDDHVVPLEAFTQAHLFDTFRTGIEFLKRAQSLDGSLPFAVMAWNYMPPSGGGLVHPHQQYFLTKFPGNQFREEWEASRAFNRKNGRSYWDELIEAEQKNGERYIGQIGNSHWMASFASMGILGEIICVFPQVYGLGDFGEASIDELVRGLQGVFRYFMEGGVFSFNGSLFLSTVKEDSFAAHFRIIPRTFLNMRDFAPDFNFCQALLQEPVSVVLPEDLCAAVRSHFGS